MQVVRAIEQEIEEGLYDGAVCLVAKNGQVFVHEAVGFSDRTAAKRMEKDAVFSVYSISKAFVSSLICRHLQQGAVALTTPVFHLLPAFQGPGKENVTVCHLLTHTAGVSMGLPKLPPELLGNLPAVVEVICKEPLSFIPGGEVYYSPVVGFALLGGILTSLDPKKRSFQDLMEEDLFLPLKMKDSFFGMRSDLIPRKVPVVFRDKREGAFPPESVELFAKLFTENSQIPAGGAVSTAKDLYLFTEMLRKKDSLLSEKTLKMATMNYTGNKPNHLFDFAKKTRGWKDVPAFLGLGFWLRGEGGFPTPFGLHASKGTFGGLGLGSTLFWIDPVRDLTFICLTAGLMEETYSIERFGRLSDLVIEEMG